MKFEKVLKEGTPCTASNRETSVSPTDNWSGFTGHYGEQVLPLEKPKKKKKKKVVKEGLAMSDVVGTNNPFIVDWASGSGPQTDLGKRRKKKIKKK